MSRSQRLFDLLHILRQYRRPVSGQILAKQVGVSIRTLYRDIASLQSMGAMIEGEAGIGYILKPGFLLPPLMFTEEEIEALILGTRWIAERTDSNLGKAARSALARITAVLPANYADNHKTSTLIIGPNNNIPTDTIDVSSLRKAIRHETKIMLHYKDETGRPSQRIIWPFALAYFESVRILLGWCEVRQDFRHFRTDRIVTAKILATRYPKRHQALFKQWCQAKNITKELD